MTDMALLEMESEGKEKSFENVRICTECGSDNTVYENGELYCKKCGLVLDG